VLEVAAGTGAVTRHLARTLPPATAIMATDLNRPMLDQAQAVGTSRPVEWRQADVMQLPLADGLFDVVVCQFGAMFFPNRAQAYSEIRRVLKPGGLFVFNVWDRLETNEFAETVNQSLATVFPDDAPQFMARVPHGYHEVEAVVRDLAAGGFTRAPALNTLAARSRADSARTVAIAFCQGTPTRNEIEARDPERLDEATNIAEAAIAMRYGTVGAVEGKMQAHILAVER
jgi:SAM-dependent methyltransferase